jgi:hypothetical protein
MIDTIILTGGPMQLVSYDGGSTGGTYTVEGINMILSGPAWALELDPSNNTCISIMPMGAVPQGAGPQNICHVGAIDSMRGGLESIHCPGCYNVSLWKGGHYQRGGFWIGGEQLSSTAIGYADLHSLHITPASFSVPEPSTFPLLAFGVLLFAVVKRKFAHYR